jgi:hypothetical protein
MATAKRTVKKTTTKKTAPKKAAATNASNQKAAGTSVEAYFAQQPADKRALLEKLRALVVKGVPEAKSTIKWGVPFYQRNGSNVCALAVFKDHVGINFFAPPEVLVDPGKKLEGAGKGNRMLKVRSASDVDSASILRWLKATVAASS